MKGIGIVSVVIGHSKVLFPGGEFIPSVEFVYIYHLMLFFFTAGAVNSPAKYSDPYTYIGRQLKGSLPLFWMYNFGYLVLHNFFSSRKLLEIPMLTVSDMVIAVSGIFTGTYIEQLAGALWFIPMLLVGKTIFAVGFQWAEKQCHNVLAHIGIVLFFSIFGIYTNHWGIYLTYHVQTAWLGIPVMYLGVLFSKYRSNVMKFINPVTCIMSTILLLLFIKMGIGYVELSINQIINPWLFYPITALGLFFATSLAATIQRSKRMTKLFAYFGAISFHIMSLHFLAFKLFDWLCGMIGVMDADRMTCFPTALNHAGIIYSLIGILMPTLAVMLLRKIKQKMIT